MSEKRIVYKVPSEIKKQSILSWKLEKSTEMESPNHQRH